MAESLDLEGKIRLGGPNYGSAQNEGIASPTQQTSEKLVINTLDEPVVETIVIFLNLIGTFLNL